MSGVGFIGLGQIGAPMASRWLDWPDGLTVFDVHAPATEPFAATGAHVAASPAEVAARATVISVMVRDDAQVTDVLTGPDGILGNAQPGTVVAIHSTVEADTPARLAALAAPHGVDVVDAPVSGGFMGAHAGTLALMVGGTDTAVAKVAEPFARLGTLVAHLGPLGAGTRAKLARNLITFAAMAAVGEASQLAEAAGVDLAKLGEVVRHSDQVTGGPGSTMLRSTTAPLTPEDGLFPIFTHTRELGLKDLDLAIALAGEHGLDLPFARLAHQRLGRALGVPDDAS
ncbi:MAG: NAD(P)-dependent oxidoreductase [Aquihabitans sp.]